MIRPAILTFVAAAALFAADTPGPQIPRKAPELTMRLPGKQIQLSQYKGYICVLAVMSTTCPHCQKLATVLSLLQPEYAPKGVQMLGLVVNPEATTEMENFARTYARGMFPVGMTTDAIAGEFLQHPPGMHYFPMIAFIDKNGVIRGEHLGATDPTFFDEKTESQNIRAELEKIFKEPTLAAPGAAKKK